MLLPLTNISTPQLLRWYLILYWKKYFHRTVWFLPLKQPSFRILMNANEKIFMMVSAHFRTSMFQRVKLKCRRALVVATVHSFGEQAEPVHI